MSCSTHNNHGHAHGQSCGHKTVKHDDHLDYLHDNHLHHVHKDHVDEHTLGVSASNSEECTPKHKCDSHDASHKHGAKCGHDAIPHGNHVDYIVSGHLHSPCGDHCDDHGKVTVG